jgi:hypothetical protein
MQRFAHDHEIKYPKAVKALFADVSRLLTHFDSPAAHSKHIRSTNPIESTFATVKLRTRVTKGAGSRARRADDGVQTAAGRAGDMAPTGCARSVPARPSMRHISGWSAKWNDKSRHQRRKRERSPA